MLYIVRPFFSLSSNNWQAWFCLLWYGAWSPLFCSEFSLITLCSKVILRRNKKKKKNSKKQSWVYSFIPCENNTRGGNEHLWRCRIETCLSGWLQSFDPLAIACLRLGVRALLHCSVFRERFWDSPCSSTWDRFKEQNFLVVRIKKLWTVWWKEELLSIVSSLWSIKFNVCGRLKLWYHFLRLEKEANLYWNSDF